MIDKTNFVLRWEIDNAAAKLATGKAESEVFNEGGFEWKTGFIPSADNPEVFDFTLECGHQRGGEWKCQIEAVLTLLHFNNENFSLEKTENLADDAKLCLFDHVTDTDGLNQHGYIDDDKLVVEYAVKIIDFVCTPAFDPAKFSSPNEMSNVTLVFGDKKLKVSKEYLSVHSPVLSPMFFGDYAEKDKEEVVMNDVVYEEFLSLMLVVFPGTVDITDRSVPHILKLADRFQMERALDQSMKHLLQSTGFDTMKKLLLADQYRLTSLKYHCLESFTSATELGKKMQTSPEYGDFSDPMKAAICDRMIKLGF